MNLNKGDWVEFYNGRTRRGIILDISTIRAELDGTILTWKSALVLLIGDSNPIFHDVEFLKKIEVDNET